MNTLKEKRKIILEGAHNVRDIGGYKIDQNHITKWRKFIRSDGLENLTKNDIEKLLDYGLKIDIDLRSKQEYDIWKDKLIDVEDISYFSVELLKDLEITSKTLGGLYVDTLESCKKEIYDVFKIILANLDKTILFHCSAGKDRTGMIAAILLMIAGVSHKDIVDDYAVTRENLAQIIDKFSYENDENLKNYLGSETEHMEKFLNYIEKKYGKIEVYLESIGINKEEIYILKEGFSEKI